MYKIIPSTFPNDHREKTGIFAVFLIYAAVYLKDIASPFIGNTISLACIGLAFLIGLIGIIFRSDRGSSLNKLSGIVLLLSMLIWFFSTLIGGTINLSSYYLAIPCAFVIVNTAPKFFLKLLVAHFIVSVLIQAYEYGTGSYLFSYVAADGDVLDEKLFGGSLDMMRAKGMFQGPLSAVAFAYWLAFIFRGSLIFSAGLLFSAFFATGRMGMSIALLLLLFRSIFKKQIQVSRSKIFLGLALLAIVFYGLFMLVDEDQMGFITSAYDVDNSQNVSRIAFWGISLQHFLNYSPVEMFFGKFGYIFAQEGGTENDFLRLLLDNGILGFLIYFLPLIIFICSRQKKYRNNSENILIGFLIIFLMNVFPFVQSLSSSLLLWLFIFTYFNSTIARKHTDQSNTRIFENTV
jgi:hypothetical protein